jgi:GTP pyrophosphokinase
LSFRHLQPRRYHQIAKLVAGRRTERGSFIAQVIQMLSQEFDRAGLRAEVSGRPKHMYSIHQKMEKYASNWCKSR